MNRKDGFMKTLGNAKSFADAVRIGGDRWRNELPYLIGQWGREQAIGNHLHGTDELRASGMTTQDEADAKIMGYLVFMGRKI